MKDGAVPPRRAQSEQRPPASSPLGAEEAQALRDEAGRIARGAVFQASELSARLLAHLVDTTIRGEPPKQDLVALHLYGDSGESEKARKAVGLLRHQLRAHYDADQTSAVRLEIPVGRYVVLMKRTEAPRSDPAQPSGPPAPPRRMPWMAAAVVAIVLPALAVVIRARPAPASLSRVVFEGRHVSVMDDRGDVAWSRDVGEPIEIPGPVVQARYWAMDDIDEDGHDDVLFIPPLAEGRRDVLTALGANGALQWRTPLGAEHEVGGRHETDRYMASLVRSLRTPSGFHGPGRVLAIAAHASTSACRVVMLDGDGILVGQYWQRGHLHAMSRWDVDGDGSDEVVLSGTDNVRDSACVIILDPREALPPGAPGGRTLTPMIAVYFPGHPALLRAEARPYAIHARPAGAELEINVEFDGAGLFYVMDRRLGVRVACSDAMRTLLESRGLDGPDIAALFAREGAEALARQVAIVRRPGREG